ncbi:hypothetical protein BLNAU_7285 [Blattamonas nauphoetae]|uniref:Uncharacterized protein n=1 Tax=Blattamonas nauphoetae TaxID=2049346 RepID=A0ABQ9Y291_9EUKA|nr:hypothetical protein BLNAU_7285 [Blattamonas nauphoetae]
MDAESEPLNTFIDSSLRDSQESGTTLNIQLEPFLHFDPNSELSFDDKSTIYSSLVALVKADHTFDNVLQDRATTFLKSIKPDGREPPGHANKLVTDLVPSSDGSRSGFVDSIIVLLSSPHSMLRAAALSCLSFIEDDSFKWNHFTHINYALKEWKRAGPEVSQSGIRMMQALISEGFEDTLEQITMIDKYGYFVLGVVEECQPISQLLGSNVEITEW